MMRMMKQVIVWRGAIHGIVLIGCLSSYACREAGQGNAAYPAGIERALELGPDRFLQKAVVGPRGDGTYVVATTQIVSPAGESIVFAGRPTDLALSPDETLLAVKSSFDLIFIDVASRQVAQALAFPETSREFPELGEGSASYCGLAWSRDGKQVWTTDAHDTLHGASRKDDGAFAWTERIYLPAFPRQSLLLTEVCSILSRGQRRRTDCVTFQSYLQLSTEDVRGDASAWKSHRRPARGRI